MTDLHVIEGEPRSLPEVDFYMSLHPCPRCGSRSHDGLRFRAFRPDERTREALHLMIGPCPDCGEQREFRFATSHNIVISDAAPLELGGPEPSQIISPVEFRDEIDRLTPVVVADPTTLGWPAYKDVWQALSRIRRCCNELMKFLPEGAIEIPLDLFHGDAARAARAARPEAYTRTALEGLRAHWETVHAAYEADGPRYHALRRAAEASPPPPSPPAFTRASLEAHRRWVADQRAPAGDAFEKARARAKAARGAEAVRAAMQEIVDIAKGNPPLVRRLEATDVAQPGLKLGPAELSGSVLTRVDLSGADFSSGTAQGVHWTEVNLRRANLSSAHLPGSTLGRCDFSEAGLALAVLGDSLIDGCTFAGARADRSTWYRCDITRTRFDGAVFGQTAFDGAVFADCSFAGASLAMDPDGVLGTMRRAWFYRCDFVDVDWSGRLLYEPVFIDCTFGAIKGTPRQVQNVILHGCTLEPAGAPLTLEELIRRWNVPAQHVTEDPNKVPHADLRSVTRHGVEHGQPITRYTEELSPLILAESARDPSLPTPAPWR